MSNSSNSCSTNFSSFFFCSNDFGPFKHSQLFRTRAESKKSFFCGIFFGDRNFFLSLTPFLKLRWSKTFLITAPIKRDWMLRANPKEYDAIFEGKMWSTKRGEPTNAKQMFPSNKPFCISWNHCIEIMYNGCIAQGIAPMLLT